ncbi:MAG: lysine 2,3-aminomutase [Bacteroidetes bacterium HGW-Bacteroidetes-1]|jgi:lysine 2,3-aminomutase|nr:MAG: lysine 2,3-aminomutase [Bacteroidetes bacterium HGW-Bacteroidetes-1]
MTLLHQNLHLPDNPELSQDVEPPASVVERVGNGSMLSSNISVSSQLFPVSKESFNFLQTHFPDATINEWSSWRWQLRNSYTSLQSLSKVIQPSDDELKPIDGVNDMLPIRITPYYAGLLASSKAGHPIRKTVVPTIQELSLQPGEASDPLSEEEYSPVPNLVHRYPDRALFLSTGFCPTYCRYCTRSHMVAKDKCHIGKKAWEPALAYLRSHTEIRDVIVSGGDPLSMPDSHIDYLLAHLRAIKHIEIIRIGTKVPVVMPMRITPALISILKKYHPLYISIHFTHPLELTQETSAACERLANAGMPLGSQTVLLKDINDDPAVMKKLFQGLLKIRVRPYYLYQCDPIPGSAHFRTPVSKGIEIIQSLRGFTSGYAVPQFVIDAPGGGGKIPLLPEYVQGYEDNNLLLKNYKGKIFKYPDVI